MNKIRAILSKSFKHHKIQATPYEKWSCEKTLLDLHRRMLHRADDLSVSCGKEDYLLGVAEGYRLSAKMTKEALEELHHEKSTL